MTDLIIQNLCKSFGKKAVLHNLCAHFPNGTTTCIMGPSGCGKTTLLRILLRLEQADSGTIQGLPTRISAVFQENRLFEEFSAVSNVAAVLPGKCNLIQIASHLSALGLTDSLSLPVKTLSGGMKRRVAIVRALLAPGDLLIMDEPCTGLDEDTKETVLSYIKKQAKGKTILIVTHNQEEGTFLDAQFLYLNKLS